MPVKKLESRNSKLKATVQNSKITSQKTKSVAKTVIKRTKSVQNKVNRTVGLSLPVFDIKGKETGSITLPIDVFGVKINPILMAQAVRVYLANQRRGTVSTKTRGEVQGSTRKIYKQKGTGRARHGSIRAPIFVHGGRVFGPKPRDYSLAFPKKMKKAALFSALSSKVNDAQVKVVDGLEKIEPKTKQMVSVLKQLQLTQKNKKVLMVLDKKNDTIIKAARNIEGVTIRVAENLTTYEVLQNKMLLFMKSAIVTMQAGKKE